jgi:5-methylcytosine-specific restriction enzyme subunit McrC
MNIPIENIYYLLCYAWNKLDEKDRVAVSIDDNTRLLDLFAKVLINATRILIKRGIDKSYVDFTTEFSGIKGKLELSQTLKSNLQLKQKTVCTFDEFSANVLTNRILVTTLIRLVRTSGLDGELKSEIKKLLWMFEGIVQIEIKPSVFAQIRLHRNNKFYSFILSVCQIIYENSLPSESAGTWNFVDFTRDERKMNQLFEAFIRNFYRIEQKVYPNVRSEIIRWNFLTTESESYQYLPQMKTDITLENEQSKIIIDAKYYKETMIENYGKEKIKSANLYQLFSYLLNQHTETEKSRTATGILLYPTIEKDYDLKFKYQSHNIFIKTINLNTSWKNIEQRLIELIINL